MLWYISKCLFIICYVCHYNKNVKTMKIAAQGIHVKNTIAPQMYQRLRVR